MNVAVLMTCHNRCATTLKCLASLRVAHRKALEQEGPLTIDVFLNDDGSTDGTSAAVKEWFRVNAPLSDSAFRLHLICGSGSDYWAKGMVRVWQAAMGYSPCSFSHFLWLNDDVVLDADALADVRLACNECRDSVLVGKLREAESGASVYGIMPNGWMTGSFVLVPRSVCERTGVLCGAYRHAWADCDYGLLCRRMNIPLREMGIVGSSPWHEARPRLTGLGLFARLSLLRDPKGWCLHDVWLFRLRNFGVGRALASSCHLVAHVLTAEWGWWKPLYAVMGALPASARKLMWRVLHKSRLVDLMNDEGFCKLQLLGAGGERYALPERGGGLNSVIAWQRLNWRSLLPKVCSDKLAVRDYVRARCGADMLNEIYPVEFDALPDAFVLKCSVGSGMNRIVRDKHAVDWKELDALMSKWLGSDYSRFCRERQYEGVRPRVFAERLLLTETGALPDDYKFMCSDGRVLFCRVDEDRHGDHRRACYSRDGDRIDVQVGYADYPVGKNPLPANWQAMVDVAERLSVGIPLVRVDLYSVRDKVVFGEMTFTSGAGFEGIRPFSFSQQMARKVRGVV